MNKTNATAMAVGLLLMAAWLTVPTGLAEAQHRGEHCLGGTLAQEQDGDNLLVKVDCTVRTAGTYKFRNVNIIKGGVLRFADATIDFWAANILVENGGSLIAGSPPGSGSDPIGTNGGVVTIHLYGQDQTGQDSQKRGKGITCLARLLAHQA